MPANGDVAQLILQVDANVAVAQRSLQDLARTVNQSATSMNSALATNDNAIGRTLTSHHNLGLAMNNGRIAQTELTAAVTRSIDAYGAGASPLRILSTEMGRLTEAASFLGGGAGNGVLGAVVRFIGGPWGIALLFGGTILAKLITSHKEATNTIGDMVKKLQEQHDKATLTTQANDIWAHSIDGVIESEKKLADQLEASLTLQTVVQRQALSSAQALIALRAAQDAVAESKFDANDPRAVKAQEAFHNAARILQADLLKFGEQEGDALADLNTRSQQWADKQTIIVRSLQTMHPELTKYGGDINAAFKLMKDAVADAATGGIPFDKFTLHLDVLNGKLEASPTFVKEYITSLKQLAQQLETTVDAAKNAPKAIDDFKKGLTGAEGVGPNKLGSSAAGFGQFMPATWEHYFAQTFPERAASMSSGQIDELRSNRTVANAVIDKATEDYVSILQHAGQQITAASLYTMHLLSSGDPHGTVALRLLNAPADEDMRGVLGKKYAADVHGNPFLAGTAGSARSAIAKRIGDSSGSVSSAAVALQDLQDRQLASNAEFQTQSEKLNGELLGAEAKILGGYGERASVQEQQVDSETKQLKDQIDAAARGKIRAGLDAKTVQAQADILKAKADELGNAKKAAIGLAAYVKLLDDQQKSADQSYADRVQDLKFSADMAKTADAQRTLQLEILDIVYAQKEYDKKILLAKQQLAGDLTGAATTQAELDRLPTDKAQDQARTLKGTQGPLEAYNSSLPHSLDEVKQRLDEIEVEGLKQLNDDLVRATTNALHLNGALGTVAGGLLKLVLDVGEGVLLNALHIPHRAAGGPAAAGQPIVVGDGGTPELFVPSTNGTILPRVPKISIPAAANNNSRGGGDVTIHQSFQFEGVAITQEQFVQGLVAARASTIQAIKDTQRRRA